MNAKCLASRTQAMRLAEQTIAAKLHNSLMSEQSSMS